MLLKSSPHFAENPPYSNVQQLRALGKMNML